MKLGTKENPVTNATVDYCGLWCKCVVCGVIAQCTPQFDFYRRKESDPLTCEHCYLTKLRSEGWKPIGFDETKH